MLRVTCCRNLRSPLATDAAKSVHRAGDESYVRTQPKQVHGDMMCINITIEALSQHLRNGPARVWVFIKQFPYEVFRFIADLQLVESTQPMGCGQQQGVSEGDMTCDPMVATVDASDTACHHER